MCTLHIDNPIVASCTSFCDPSLSLAVYKLYGWHYISKTVQIAMLNAFAISSPKTIEKSKWHSWSDSLLLPYCKVSGRLFEKGRIYIKNKHFLKIKTQYFSFARMKIKGKLAHLERRKIDRQHIYKWEQ